MATVNRQLKPYPPTFIEVNDTSNATGTPEVTNPMGWTLHRTDNDNTKNDTTGAVYINAGYYWLTGAYSTAQAILSARNKLSMTPITSTNSKGGWGISYDNAAKFVQQLEFCWHRRTTGNWQVWELGVMKYDSGSTAYQSLTIDVNTSGVVTYYRNDVLVYTSLTAVSGDFYWKVAAGAYAYDSTFTTADYSYGQLTASTYTTGTGLIASGRVRLDWNNRNRVLNTTITKPNATTEALEGTQTSTLRIYASDGVTLLRTVTGITADFYEYPVATEIADSGGSLQASLRIELESIRDGVVSLQKHNFTITR